MYSGQAAAVIIFRARCWDSRSIVETYACADSYSDGGPSHSCKLGPRLYIIYETLPSLIDFDNCPILAKRPWLFFPRTSTSSFAFQPPPHVFNPVRRSSCLCPVAQRMCYICTRNHMKHRVLMHCHAASSGERV